MADGVSEFTRQAANGQSLPSDPWEHASKVVDPTKQKIKDFQDLFDSQWMLGYIKDNELVRLYQQRMGILEDIFYITKSESGLTEFFSLWYHKSRAQFGMTRNKDGYERGKQSEVGLRSPSRTEEGYGYSANDQLQTQKEHEKNILQRILNRGN